MGYIHSLFGKWYVIFVNIPILGYYCQIAERDKWQTQSNFYIYFPNKKTEDLRQLSWCHTKLE